MPHLDTRLRAGIAVLTAATAICFGLSVSAMHTRQTTGHAVAASQMPDVPGCSEVTISSQPDSLGTNGAVNEKTPRAVVDFAQVGAGSHIGLTGDSSCLWITGNIGPNVAISVSGSGNGVIIQGTVDPSVRIEVGPGSITWIPKLESPSQLHGAPDLRISDDDGGRLIINGMQTIEP